MPALAVQKEELYTGSLQYCCVEKKPKAAIFFFNFNLKKYKHTTTDNTCTPVGVHIQVSFPLSFIANIPSYGGDDACLIQILP